MDFALRFQRLAIQAEVKDDKAARQLVKAVKKHAPKLSNQLEALHMQGNCLLDAAVKFSNTNSKYEARMGQDGPSTASASPATQQDRASKVVHEDRACPIPGHIGHSMHECRALQKHIAQIGQQKQSRKQFAQVHVTHPVAPGSIMQEMRALRQEVERLQVHATPSVVPDVASGYAQSRQDARWPQQRPHYPRPQATSYAPPPAPVYNTNLPTQSSARAIYPPPRAGQVGSSLNCPPCPECGRNHPSYAVCYGRNYERFPHAAGHATHQATPQAHVTAAPVQDFVSNADLSWPPPMSMMTVGMSSAGLHATSEDALVSAATPVPFEASSTGADLYARGKGSLHADHASEQRSAASQPTANATVILPIGDLDEAALLQLRRTCPPASITVSVNVKTAAGLLARTPIFEEETHPVSAVSQMSAASNQVQPQVDQPKSPGEAERNAYLAKTASLYRLEEGFHLRYKGEYKAGFAKVLYDSCSEVRLLSQGYADAQGIQYKPCNLQIATSLGGTGSVVGMVDSPCMLC
ncbi:hypothetical protein DUNSADRAFT_10767 [Dunaliella salina]|uniref:Uncharacterized protein n=1 Tax=Dunaliella salina TaxID=3046 RepID=A0ABQ7GEI4_DUNSA|nr:hypothetical protein DUNSADRAFT_10767 [Dunaliella salina]|eukprot:KAF5833021.1 hypothetical protein DUNSADRAFT_10767 [Dunaliella salina]